MSGTVACTSYSGQSLADLCTPRSLIKLNVKHLTDKSRLNYGDLASNGFPEGRLDGDRLISISDVPSNDFPAPVLDVQATFVPGGLLLTIYFHHTVCDAYCMGKLIDLMSAATRGEKPPSDLVPAQLRNEVLERSLDTSHKGKLKQQECPTCFSACSLPARGTISGNFFCNVAPLTPSVLNRSCSIGQALS